MSNYNITILSLESGDSLSGRYRLEKVIGEGGMGVVWLALDTSLDDRPVAIKVLPTQLSRDERSIARLKAEAIKNLNLTHRHIVRLINFEQDSKRTDTAFLIMQYVQGQTLNELLAEHPEGLELERVTNWASQIAGAIDYAHERSVLHRDIKPRNIIIETKTDLAYLMDFGIAREAKNTMTRENGVKGQSDSSGTTAYMSPQQLVGKNGKSNDIYSFAATLYEALCGHPPFRNGSIEYQIKEIDPKPIKDQPDYINKILLQGLAKQPENRPMRAVSLAACMTPASSAFPITSSPPTSVPAMSRQIGDDQITPHKSPAARSNPRGNRTACRSPTTKRHKVFAIWTLGIFMMVLVVPKLTTIWSAHGEDGSLQSDFPHQPSQNHNLQMVPPLPTKQEDAGYLPHSQLGMTVLGEIQDAIKKRSLKLTDEGNSEDLYSSRRAGTFHIKNGGELRVIEDSNSYKTAYRGFINYNVSDVDNLINDADGEYFARIIYEYIDQESMLADAVAKNLLEKLLDLSPIIDTFNWIKLQNSDRHQVVVGSEGPERIIMMKREFLGHIAGMDQYRYNMDISISTITDGSKKLSLSIMPSDAKYNNIKALFREAWKQAHRSARLPEMNQVDESSLSRSPRSPRPH